MNDVYREKSKDLSDYERAFPAVEAAVGMAVALNGRMAGADLFDRSATACKLWPKLVRSYAMDALDGEKGESIARERAERLLRRLVGARIESYPSIGLGQDLRLEGDRAVGSALVFEGIVVHLGIFRIHGRRSQAGSPGIASASLWRRLRNNPDRQVAE